MAPRGGLEGPEGCFVMSNGIRWKFERFETAGLNLADVSGYVGPEGITQLAASAGLSTFCVLAMAKLCRVGGGGACRVLSGLT